MDAAKILEVQRPRTPRGRGIGTIGGWVRELGKPSLAPGLRVFAREAMDAYKPLAKSRPAGRVAGGP